MDRACRILQYPTNSTPSEPRTAHQLRFRLWTLAASLRARPLPAVDAVLLAEVVNLGIKHLFASAYQQQIFTQAY